MSRLTRDGTAEPVSRDHILRRERGQRNVHFTYSAETTNRIENLTQLIRTLLKVLTTVYNVTQALLLVCVVALRVQSTFCEAEVYRWIILSSSQPS